MSSTTKLSDFLIEARCDLGGPMSDTTKLSDFLIEARRRSSANLMSRLARELRGTNIDVTFDGRALIRFAKSGRKTRLAAWFDYSEQLAKAAALQTGLQPDEALTRVLDGLRRGAHNGLAACLEPRTETCNSSR